MKKQNLYNRIYDHSFSLLISFSFYSLLLILLVFFKQEGAFTLPPADQSQLDTLQDNPALSASTYLAEKENVDSRDNQGNIMRKFAHDEVFAKKEHLKQPWLFWQTFRLIITEQNPLMATSHTTDSIKPDHEVIPQ